MRKNRVSSANLSNLPALRHGLAKEDFQSERKTPVLSVQGGLVFFPFIQKKVYLILRLQFCLETINKGSMENLQGKKAIITGGSRGLGKAIAHAFAKEGIHVIITGRNQTTLQEVTQELNAQYHKNNSYVVFDVSNYGQVREAIQGLLGKLGTVDILVNNAGIAAFGSVLDMEVSTWEHMIQTNLLGMYYVTKEILPTMVSNNEGDIFNISSTAGLNGNATTSAYSASKFGVIGFSESLMKEVRKFNIKVSTLTPSTVASDMSINLGLTDGNTERVLQPEDFAALLIAALKLPRRALLKSASLLSTNP